MFFNSIFQFFSLSKNLLNKKSDFFLPFSEKKVIFCHFLEIKISIFVSPELSSVRDYVITHSVRSMYILCVCMYVCGILQN